MYDKILKYGNFIPLDIKGKPSTFLRDIEDYHSVDWAPYNPRKEIDREGLSLISENGNFGGVDLDSLGAYNNEHNTEYNESSFSIDTPAAQFAADWINPWRPHVKRSHVIRLGPGGYFPTHRDDFRDEITTMRIFIPLINCNPNNMWFMLEDKTLNFNHGQSYFINTCLSHTVFATYEAMFIVLNVEVNEDTFAIIMNKMSR